MVYDADERILCWFNIDADGRPLGRGNHRDGNLNQHYYGPVADMGDVHLRRWGVQSTGSVRFEYLSARMSDEALEEPRPGTVPKAVEKPGRR